MNLKSGEALKITIEGLDSMLIIEMESSDLDFGTIIEINRGKFKHTYYNESLDDVKLIDTLKKFSIAHEFNILAKVSIKGFSREEQIKPYNIKEFNSFEGYTNVSSTKYIQDFSEVDPDLEGKMIIDIFLNNQGKLANLYSDKNNYIKNNKSIGLISLDGIKVAEIIYNLQSKEIKKKTPNFPIHAYIFGEVNYLLNIKGNSKPPLSVNRFPLFNPNKNKLWQKIETLCVKTCALLWSKILRSPIIDNWNLFYQFERIKGFSLGWLNTIDLWNYLLIPIDRGKKIIKLGDIDKFYFKEEWYSDYYSVLFMVMKLPFGTVIWEDLAIDKDNVLELHDSLQNYLSWLLIKMASIDIENNNIVFIIEKPTNETEIPNNNILSWNINEEQNNYSKYDEDSKVVMLKYNESLKEILCVDIFFSNVNRDHPIVRKFCESKFSEEKEIIQIFAEKVIKMINLDHDYETELKKELGNLYEQIDWNKIHHKKCKPPYRKWKKGQIIEFTEEVIRSWKE